MPKKEKTSGLEKLFEEQVMDMYYAEKKLVKALKKMAGKASDQKLMSAFQDHREETEGHVQRLEQVFELLGKRAKGKTCHAMDGLIEEAQEIMEDFEDDPALDAALVVAAQKVEHYEIGTYGSLIAYADELGLSDASKILKEILKEEKACDQKLTSMAETSLNAAGEAHRGQGKETKNGKANSANGSGKGSPTDIGKTKQSRTPSTVG